MLNPLFLLCLFWPPPFSIYLALSLSLVMFFLSSFLSFFFACFWFLVFVVFLVCFCLFCFYFMKGTTSTYSIAKLFSSIISLFFGFPVLFSHWNPFFLSLIFLIFELCFLFNINVFGFKKHKLENTNFWSRGGLQQFCMSLCFAKCEMLSFLAIFCQILVDVRKTM